MSALTFFGLFAVPAMLVCYAVEGSSPWWISGFAIACLLGCILRIPASIRGGSESPSRQVACRHVPLAADPGLHAPALQQTACTFARNWVL